MTQYINKNQIQIIPTSILQKFVKVDIQKLTWLMSMLSRPTVIDDFAEQFKSLKNHCLFYL